MSKNNIIPLNKGQVESKNRLSFTLEEMLKEFENGAIPRSKYWRELITALYDTANHVVTGVTSVANVKPDNVGNIPLLPKDIDAPAMVRMDGADSNNQQTNQDVFGRSLFYGDACKVVHQYGAYYEVLAGTAYVAGIRFFYPGMQELLIEEVPNKVWVDVSWPSDPMISREPVVNIFLSNNEHDNNAADDIYHYVEKLSEINSDNENLDCRNSSFNPSLIRIDQTQAITHNTVDEASSDDNTNRSYIKVASTLDYYKKVKETPYDFIDKSGHLWRLYTKSFHFVDSDVIYNVGVSGDFNDINSALEYLSRYKTKYVSNGYKVELILQSGFVIREQVFVKSFDFSWVTISSNDEVVYIDDGSISDYLIEKDDSKPVFGGVDNAILPILNIMCTYVDNETAGDGVSVFNESSVIFKPGSGIKKCRRGIQVLYGSSASCYMFGLTRGGAGSGSDEEGVDFSNCKSRALHVAYNSKAGLARSNFSHGEGDYGVYIIWGSHADVYQSDISYIQNGFAITCRDGSYCNARETDVNNSIRGYHALHGAIINARRSVDSEYGQNGAKNCTGYGIIANDNGIITADSQIVDGSVIGVHASANSRISFQNGSANNCESCALYALGCSTINADLVLANNCDDNAIWAFRSSIINCRDAQVNNCKKIAISAEHGSIINADSSIANNSTNHSYYANESSTIQARNSQANNIDSDIYAVSAIRSSTINFRGGSTTGRVHSLEGSNVNAQSTTASMFYVERGSVIIAGSANGELSQTENEITAHGIIYKYDAEPEESD